MRFTKSVLTVICVGYLAGGASATSMVWFGNSFSDEGKIYVGVPWMINCDTCGIQENLTIDSLLPQIVPSCFLSCQETTWPAFTVIDSGHYDYVVAQDNLANWCYQQYNGTSSTYAAQITNWANHAKGAGGQLVLEQMWVSIGGNYPQSTQDQSDFWYDSVTRATNSLLVPCGRAWWTAHSQRPNLEYIDPNWNDGNHPGLFGRYLNCCVFYAALTGVSPVGLKFKCDGWGYTDLVDDTDALFAQQKAWEAYQYFFPPSNIAISNFKAAPSIAVRNVPGSIAFSATVTDDKSITSVMLDLSTLNGPANVAMTANGSTYSYTYSFPTNTSIGTKTVSVRATDNAGHYLIRKLPFKIENPLAISAVKAIHYTAKVRVFFNDTLDKTTAENVANYAIDHGVTVTQAQLEADSQVVTLVTSALSAGTNYTLTVSNVKDDAGSVIPANTTAGFLLDLPLPGVAYNYYEAASITSVNDLSTLTPKGTGADTNFNLNPAQQTSVFGLIFSGLINITTLGRYTFYTTADDADQVYIDGINIVGTNYGTGELSNSLTLDVGFHNIQVKMYQNGGGEGLSMSWSGPSIAKSVIPGSVLFYDPSSPVRAFTSAVSRTGTHAIICHSSNGNLLIKSETETRYHVAVYSTSGRIVKSGSLDKGASLVLTSRDCSSGIYIVKIDDGRMVDTQRIKLGF